MNAEQVRQLTDESLNSLAAALEAGRSEELTRYLACMARFHKYSFGNIMLIAVQRPDASAVAGFHAWRKLGRFVKKGEKGIAIIAPMLLRRRDESEGDSAADAERIVRFRVVHVFDIAQTEGEELPELVSVSGDPGHALDRLRAFADTRAITVRFVDCLPGALGTASNDGIEILSGRPAGETVSTLIHELAHMLLHVGPDVERPTSKAVRETEAEAVACVVSQAIGLDAAAASRDYIQLLQGDAKLLAASMERIRATATLIISAVIDEEVADEALAA